MIKKMIILFSGTQFPLPLFSHTYTHTHIHTYTHMHIYIHTYIHIYIHTYIHTYIQVAGPPLKWAETAPLPVWTSRLTVLMADWLSCLEATDQSQGRPVVLMHSTWRLGSVSMSASYVAS